MCPPTAVNNVKNTDSQRVKEYFNCLFRQKQLYILQKVNITILNFERHFFTHFQMLILYRFRVQQIVEPVVVKN